MWNMNGWQRHAVALCVACGLSATATTGSSTLWGQTAALGELSESGTAPLPSADTGEDDRLPMGLATWITKYPGVAGAKDRLAAGNREEAMRQLLTAVEDHPELPQAEVILAEFYFAARQPAAAVAALDRAAVQMPADPEPYLILANFAFTQNRNTDARVLFDKAATLVKDLKAVPEKRDRILVRLHAGQASVAERADAWERAIPHLEAWIKADPKNPAARVRLARALFRTNQGKAAYVQAQQAAEMNENFARAPVMIAQFYAEMGKNDLAAKWLTEAEKRYGEDLNTRLLLAEREWREGRPAEAKRHVTAANKIDPKSPKVALLAGMIAHLEHNYAAAQKNFERARQSAPDDFQPRNHLAMVLAAQGGADNLDQALRLAQANREDFPQSALAAATLGFVQLQLGQTEEAGKNFQLAGSTGRGTGDMVYFFAKFWMAGDDKQRAREILAQLLGSGNKTLFVFRKDAEALYAELGAE